MRRQLTSVAGFMGNAGHGWIKVDVEHGSINVCQPPDQFRAFALDSTLSLVRLAGGHKTDCKEAVDAGAGSVVVPMVESAEQLIAVRSATHRPLEGIGNVGFSRANLFGKRFGAYIDEAPAPLLIAVIEHVRAVEQLEALIAIDVLDAILIGPYNVSGSTELTAQFHPPEFMAAMDRVRETCERRGMPCGAHVVMVDPVVFQQRVDEGHRFIAYSIDSVFPHASADHPCVSAP